MRHTKILFTVLLALLPASSSANSTVISQSLNPGVLQLSSAPTATLTPTTLNGGTSTGSLGSISVNDGRGSGAGWSVTATASNFTNVGSPVRTSGSGGGITVAGAFTGSTSGTYTVTISTGGSTGGTAAFTVSGLENQPASPVGASVPLGTKGLTLSFDPTSYAFGQQWTVAVGVIPVSKMTISPSELVTSNNPAGVLVGPSHTFTSPTDSATILTAPAGKGMGLYTTSPALSLVVPAGLHSGTYTSTITETIN